jgi:hypothetical protein
MDSRRDVLGCSRKRKERLDNLEKEDREPPRHEIRDPKQNQKTTPKRPQKGFCAERVSKIQPGGP